MNHYECIESITNFKIHKKKNKLWSNWSCISIKIIEKE